MMKSKQRLFPDYLTCSLVLLCSLTYLNAKVFRAQEGGGQQIVFPHTKTIEIKNALFPSLTEKSLSKPSSSTTATRNIHDKVEEKIGMIITVGQEEIRNNYNDYPAPYGNYQDKTHQYFLIRREELWEAGLSSGTITSLAFDVATPASTFCNLYKGINNFSIKMGHTMLNEITDAPDIALQEVYESATFTEEKGWNYHIFTTPFKWDGYRNIIIEVSFCNKSHTANAQLNHSKTGYYSSALRLPEHRQTKLFMYRPNIRLSGVPTSQAPKITHAVSAKNPRELWGIGEDHRLYHWNGEFWKEVPVTGITLFKSLITTLDGMMYALDGNSTLWLCPDEKNPQWIKYPIEQEHVDVDHLGLFQNNIILALDKTHTRLYQLKKTEWVPIAYFN